MGKVALRLAFGLLIFGIVIYFVDVSEAVVVLLDLDLDLVLVAAAFASLLDLDLVLVAAAFASLLASRGVVALKWWVLLGGPRSSVTYAAVQRAVLCGDRQCDEALGPAQTANVSAASIVVPEPLVQLLKRARKVDPRDRVRSNLHTPEKHVYLGLSRICGV